MIGSHYEHIERVTRSVEQRIQERPDRGVLDAETVLALDIVMHALVFTEAEGGHSLWREALWQRALSERARAAVVLMLEHLMSAAARGEMGAVTEICNCLRAVVEPDVFRADQTRTGVVSTGTPGGSA